jgi:glycosyltransferase involved in cell wall biosynthesis
MVRRPSSEMMAWPYIARVEPGREQPLVSVFTAAHEIGAKIETAHQSLLRQTYCAWEWVVVDDSATPDTARHVTQLAEGAEPDRIRLLRLDSHAASIGASKSVAGAACRGRFLVELDHDDELRPDALELIAATFMAHPDVDFLYSDWVDWEDRPGGGVAATYPPGWGLGFGAYASEEIDGRRVPVALAPPLTWETLRHIVSIPNHVRAWRSDFYRRLGGHDRELPIADDYQLVIRSFLDGTIARVPRPLYVQHHDVAGGNASRRRNPEIQRRVAEIAARYEQAIDRRCLSLGVTASPPAPLTGWKPLACASVTLDVVAEAAADRGCPLVSVVVPTYRRPELLRRALASISEQTYDNLEILVVGDDCPDVDAVIESLADSRIRHSNLRAHAADSGASPRNYALKTMARGTLVAYLDDDNRWRRDHLESLVDVLQSEPAPSFAFASLQIDGEAVICRTPRRMQIDTSALLHRRSLLDRFGYWRGAAETDWAHDWELVSRWAQEPWKATLEPTVTYTVEQSQRGARLRDAIRAVAEDERSANPKSPSSRLSDV